MDTATDAAIRRAFETQLPHVTKLIIAQRISSVMDADRILVMDEGRLAACGTHEELMRSCRAYREIYDSQKDSGESPSAGDGRSARPARKEEAHE